MKIKNALLREKDWVDLNFQARTKLVEQYLRRNPTRNPLALVFASALDLPNQQDHIIALQPALQGRVSYVGRDLVGVKNLVGLKIGSEGDHTFSREDDFIANTPRMLVRTAWRQLRRNF